MTKNLSVVRLEICLLWMEGNVKSENGLIKDCSEFFSGVDQWPPGGVSHSVIMWIALEWCKWMACHWLFGDKRCHILMHLDQGVSYSIQKNKFSFFCFWTGTAAHSAGYQPGVAKDLGTLRLTMVPKSHGFASLKLQNLYESSQNFLGTHPNPVWVLKCVLKSHPKFPTLAPWRCDHARLAGMVFGGKTPLPKTSCCVLHFLRCALAQRALLLWTGRKDKTATLVGAFSNAQWNLPALALVWIGLIWRLRGPQIPGENFAFQGLGFLSKVKC